VHGAAIIGFAAARARGPLPRDPASTR